VVAVLGPDGCEIARGVAQYDHREIERIKGAHSGDIARILGYDYGTEIIHRNDLVNIRQVNCGGTAPNGSPPVKHIKKGTR
jgi:glutamate 5-kinase